MDRNIVYPGAIPLDTDPLSTNRNAMIAIGGMLAAVLGSSIVADGLAVTPTGPASMSVVVAGGSITLLTTVDGSAYGSLTSSTDPLVKMGVNTASTTLGPLTAPGTSGQSIVYLIQAAFNEADDTPVALPYYNASNPSIPYSGPGNSGATQNTRRRQSVALSAKAGVAATTGSQVAPSPDSGYVGLYDVTIAYGASSIISGNIAMHAGAPFLGVKLPGAAPLASPAFTGVPTAPTPTGTDSSTKLATTAFLPAAFVVMQSLGTNGYQKLPGGFILQWATVSVPGTGGVTWTFPVAFGTACYGVVGMSNSGSGSGGPVSALAASSVTASNALIDYTSDSDVRTAFVVALGK